MIYFIQQNHEFLIKNYWSYNNMNVFILFTHSIKITIPIKYV